MTNDERIQRLTELARRVWPDANVDMECRSFGVYLGEECVWFCDADFDSNPRALDALEAALLVLAGEAPLVASGQGAICKLVPGLPIDHDAERQIDALVTAATKREPLAPAWVEQLAEEWEHRAAKWVSVHDSHHDEDECADACYAEAKQVLNCADELRERAKEGR